MKRTEILKAIENTSIKYKGLDVKLDSLVLNKNKADTLKERALKSLESYF